MIAKPRAAALKIVVVYWTLLILGMVTYTALRLDAVTQLEPVWTGAIGGSALGQLVAAKRYRTWVAMTIVLAIAMVLLPQMPHELGGKRLWLAFLPAALCGYWSLGDRTSLAAFWFPAMIWMLSILDGTHANALPGREGLVLFAALTALFVVYLRVREERRVALWQTVAPEPVAIPKPAVIVQDRTAVHVARTAWGVLVTGLGFGVTAWLAPLLWQPEVNAGGHSTAHTLDAAYDTATAHYVATREHRLEVTHHRPTHYARPVDTSPGSLYVPNSYEGSYAPTTTNSDAYVDRDPPPPKLPCCPIDDEIYTKHVRVKEFLAIGRSDEEAEHKPKFACRPCTYAERYPAPEIAYSNVDSGSDSDATEGDGYVAVGGGNIAVGGDGDVVGGDVVGGDRTKMGSDPISTAATMSRAEAARDAFAEQATQVRRHDDERRNDVRRDNVREDDLGHNDFGHNDLRTDSSANRPSSSTNVASSKTRSAANVASTTANANATRASTNTNPTTNGGSASSNAANTSATTSADNASSNGASGTTKAGSASSNVASASATTSAGNASSIAANANATTKADRASSNAANTTATTRAGNASSNPANTNVTTSAGNASSNAANANATTKPGSASSNVASASATTSAGNASSNAANANATTRPGNASSNAANTSVTTSAGSASSNVASTEPTTNTGSASSNGASTATSPAAATATGASASSSSAGSAASSDSDVVASRPAETSSSSFLHWIVLLMASLFATQLVALALRPIRRAIALRHLRRPYWQETVDQRISNSWQLVLVGLRDAGWRADSTESPRELARRVGIDGVERCATILDRARHGIRIDREDLDDMTATADGAYRDARKRVRGVGRAASWLRWPLV